MPQRPGAAVRRRLELLLLFCTGAAAKTFGINASDELIITHDTKVTSAPASGRGVATGQPAAQTGEADGLFRSRLPSNRTMGPAPYPRSPWFASYDASAVSRYYNSSVQLVCGLARAAHTTTSSAPKPAKCATSPDQVRRACPGSCRSTLRPAVVTWGRMPAPVSRRRVVCP